MMPHLGHTELTVDSVAAGVYMWALVKDTKEKALSQPLSEDVSTLSIQLTFAGLHAIEPPVINVFVTGTSTVLKPSTARSATTGSVRFLKRAAFWARHWASDLWRAN